MEVAVYSRFKLTRKERADLQVVIDDISFTCGAPLQDLQLPGTLVKCIPENSHVASPLRNCTKQQNTPLYVQFQRINILNGMLVKTSQKS